MTAVPLVFLDTETTGLHPKREIWEYGLIRREPDGTEREFHAFVDVNLRHADPFALEVGRFYERSSQGRWLAGLRSDPRAIASYGVERLWVKWEVCREIAQLTHGAHIVGAVVNFDTETIARDLRECGLTPAWHYHLIDVEALAVGYLAAVKGLGQPYDSMVAPPWDSEELSRQLDVEPPGVKDRHTALGDARWARDIYDAVMTP